MTTFQTEISRRHLLAGLGLGSAVLLVPGCSSAVNSQKGSGTQPSGAPAKGGTLQAGISQDLIPANTFTNSTYGVTTMIGMVYEGLIRYPNNNVEPEPRLATSWKLAKDGMSLVLNLRQGVTFHTGRPFTSADAAFSLKNYASSTWNGQMISTAASISKYDTSDPHRLVLHFSHPLGNIFDLLDTVPIVDSKTISGISTGKQFVGTGPFKFVSWTPGSELVFEKNDNYWVPGRPFLDGARFAIVPDPTSLTSQLKSGQIDFANGLSNRDAQTLRAGGDFTVTQLTGAENQIYVGANVEAAPLSDIRIRQAIAYSIDRDRIMSEVFRGSGYVTNLPWPKYSSAYSEAKNKTYAINPAKAKALVAQVGGTLKSIPYTYQATVPVHAATAAIVQANLKAVGIPVTLNPIDSATFVKELIGAQFEGLWTTFHSWAQYTPSTLTVSAYPFNAAKNASHYSSSTYSNDANAAWTVANGRTPAALADYSALSDDLLQSLFLTEIGVIELQFVTSPKLQGVSYTKRAEINLTNATLAT